MRTPQPYCSLLMHICISIIVKRPVCIHCMHEYFQPCSYVFIDGLWYLAARLGKSVSHRINEATWCWSEHTCQWLTDMQLAYNLQWMTGWLAACKLTTDWQTDYMYLQSGVVFSPLIWYQHVLISQKQSWCKMLKYANSMHSQIYKGPENYVFNIVTLTFNLLPWPSHPI